VAEWIVRQLSGLVRAAPAAANGKDPVKRDLLDRV
jgi:hypothetical protein